MGKEFALYDSQGRTVWYSQGVPGDEARTKSLGVPAWEFCTGESREKVSSSMGKALMGLTSIVETEAMIHGHRVQFKVRFEPAPTPTSGVAVIATFWMLPPEISRLSKGERRVASLIGRGLNTKRIAKEMKVATSTVDSYRIRLKAKLNMDHSQMIAWCVLHAELLYRQ